MKKFIALAVLVMACMATVPIQAQQNQSPNKSERKAQKEAERTQRKAQEKAENALLYNNAVAALKANQFVLEADKVIFRSGEAAYVNSNTNFVLVNQSHGTVQVAFNTSVAGPNGIGGVTVDGNVTNVSSTTNKKGDTTYSFSVQGTGISAQVFLTLSNGGNEAVVNISPNFNSNTLTLQGKLIPLEQSDIFKGHAW